MNIVPLPKVNDFIKSIDKVPRAKLAKIIDLLEEFGNKLGMPHSKYISRNLYELRIRGKQEIRVFYCFGNNSAFLLHGFIKKSQKTPIHEIEQAIRAKSTLDL